MAVLAAEAVAVDDAFALAVGVVGDGVDDVFERRGGVGSGAAQAQLDAQQRAGDVVAVAGDAVVGRRRSQRLVQSVVGPALRFREKSWPTLRTALASSRVSTSRPRKFFVAASDSVSASVNR